MNNKELALIGDALVPATNGRAPAPVSPQTQKELAAVAERIDAKMLIIREGGRALEEVYKLTSWKWLEGEALHQVILQLVPEELTPEDEMFLNHLKRQYQLGLLALSDEAVERSRIVVISLTRRIRKC